MEIAAKRFKFGRNELDLGRYELRRGDRRLPLSRMPMELLILLVERRGRLVRREEIATHLWPDSSVVDVEQGINASIKRIRAILNDDVSKPRFIETVVGKGYRFIGEVEEAELEPSQAAIGPTTDALVEQQGRIETAIEIFPPAPQPQSTARAPVRWRWLAAALAVALLVAGWYATAWWKRRPDTTEHPIFRQVTALIPENRATAAAISPDGNLTAYANADGIFIQTRDGETTPLREPADFVVDQLAWFSSGTKLLASGFSEQTYIPAIWTVYVTGRPPRLLRAHARKGTPSPDEKRVAFTSEDRATISIMEADGAQPRQVLAGSWPDTFPLLFWPVAGRLGFQRRHYAPGRRVANLSSSDSPSDTYYERSYESLDLATGKVVAMVPDLWMESTAALPDGRLLFLRCDPSGSHSLELWEVPTDLRTGAFLDAPHAVASLAGKDDSLEVSGMSASRDGKSILVLRQSNQYAVFVGDYSANPPRISRSRRLTLNERADFPHAWTRDSQAVIFESNRYGDFDLFRQEITKRTAEPIARTSQPEVLPQMWPGGKWILYRTWAPGEKYSNSKLMRVPVEGGIPEEVPIGGPLDEFRCAIGSGKRCVLRTTILGQSYVFYELDPIRGKGPELARTKWLPGVLGDWDIAPDGREVAIPNHSTRDARIRLVKLKAKPGEAAEHDIVVPNITNLNSLTAATDGSGWFVPLETSVGSRLLYVWRDGHSASLGDIPGWVVPSPNGRRVAFLNQIVAANAWLFERH